MIHVSNKTEEKKIPILTVKIITNNPFHNSNKFFLYKMYFFFQQNVVKSLQLILTIFIYITIIHIKLSHNIDHVQKLCDIFFIFKFSFFTKISIFMGYLDEII